MNVFLKKVRAKTPFAWLDPVRVEPLELAYLEAAAKKSGARVWILDELFGLLEPPVEPDVVVLTGYNTAEEAIRDEARAFRRRFPAVRIIVGGVHVQRNRTAFQDPAIDIIFHSADLERFAQLLERFAGIRDHVEGAGFDEQIAGRWIAGASLPVRWAPWLAPDRSLTERVMGRTRYLDKTRVALVKGRTGCPFQCDFCYCRLINDGIHIPADYGAILTEALALEADHCWIVDDVFLASRRDAQEFIRAAREKQTGQGQLKLIVYLRADFILNNRDLLADLKKSGLSEVIVGFEATTNSELDAYNKQTDALDYPAVIALLKAHEIDLTALFMVSPAYGRADFRQLAKFLKTNQVETYTISILTPIPGTQLYEEIKDQLITREPEKFDFLHLVTRSRLPRPLFYFLFLKLHLRLLRSNRIRRFIRQSLFNRPVGP